MGKCLICLRIWMVFFSFGLVAYSQNSTDLTTPSKIQESKTENTVENQKFSTDSITTTKHLSNLTTNKQTTIDTTTTKKSISKLISTPSKEISKQSLTTTNAITKNIITTEKLTTNTITKNIITTEKLTTNKNKSTTKKIKNKPMSPADIFSKNITSNSIILTWNLSINNNTNNSPKGYNITNNNTNSSFNTNTTIFTITNLTACTKYCFTIQSYNDDGFSPSINKCFNTKSPNLSSILLSNIPSQYLSYRNITWQYLGSNVCSIKYQLQYRIIPYFNNTITTKESFYNITNLTLNVNYTIRVRAISENETDNGSKQGQFSNNITFLTTAKSAIPENISLIKSGVDHLELKWDKPITNVTHGPPESCIIKYNNSQTKNTTKEQFIKIDNLKECSKYCFTIQCYNLAGWSPKSANYCHFTKSPKLSNITLSNIENGSNQIRRISWNYSTNNCPIKFEIEITNKNNNNTKQILFVENQLFYNITNLNINEIYLIKIRAKTDIETENGIKEGSFSNIVEFYTGEKQIKVNNFTHKMYWKERKLEIYWQIEEKYFQAILYYIVKLIDQSNNCLKVIVYYCLNNTKVQQYQLNKYSQLFDNCPRNNSIYFNGNLTIFKDQIQIDKQINKYNLQIIAINLVGTYNIVDTINIELKKPAIPGTISLATNDLNNIKLSWKECIEDDINGDADGYEITNTNTSLSDNTIETIAIFHKLNQCSTYCFTIKSYNDAGMSSPSIEQCFTTKSPKLSGINLSSIASEYKSSRFVQWKYLGTENCPIKYQLQYWINNSNQIKNNKLIETTQSKYEIKQLELNHIYAINIRAMTQYNTTDGSIYGQFSDNIEFYTGSENISIDNFDGSIKWSDKMLSISWNIGDQYKDAILYYIVKILDESNNICFNTFTYKCEKCSRIHNNIDENYLKNMSIFSGNCRNKIETFELFKGDEIKFQKKKTINTEKEIFNIEIYGVNLRGLHKILNQSIEASPSKPAPPEDIIPINITSSYIHLSWPASIKNSTNSAAKGYSILQSNNNNNYETQNTTNTQIKINNLTQCTKYCFIIYSYNTAGMSQPSKEKCFHTKSPELSNIILSNISSEYRAIRNISWRYIGKEICPIKYQIKYSNYNIQQINYSNNQFYELTNLNLNDIYWINVRPISELETDDGGIEGPWSNKVTFYTGLVQPKLMNFKENYNFNDETFDIFLSVNKSLNQKILGYLIMVKNDKNDNNNNNNNDNNNNCHLMIVLKCGACQNSGFNEKIFEQKFQQIKSSTKCSNEYNSSFFHQSPNITTSMKKKLPIGKYIVEYYGYNLLGFQYIGKTTNEVKKPANNISTIFIVISLLLVIFLVVFIVVYTVRRKKMFQSTLNGNNLNDPSAVRTEHINQLKTHLLMKVQGGKNEKTDSDLDVSDCTNLSEFLSKIQGYEKTIQEFPNYYELMSKNNGEKLISQYQVIAKLTVNLEKQLHLTKFVGKVPYNLKKNRFFNILPFDQNIVLLKDKPASENYLNANSVPFSDDRDKIEYIASQGPIESTISDFISMIWEQNISCIVMLTRPVEDDKFKCLQYWSDNLNSPSLFGQKKEYQIIVLSEQNKTSYFEREFSLTNMITNEVRTVTHVFMHLWQDFSAPEVKDFECVLTRFQQLKESSIESPFLIHCSAGVGRTGTFICLDRIVGLLNKGKQEIDVFKSVLELRASRNFMVQRQAQYIFIHEFLNFYINEHFPNTSTQASISNV